LFTDSEKLRHYKLGDLGLVPRQEQCMSAGSTSRQLLTTDRRTLSKKVPCHSVATQTISAIKVNLSSFMSHDWILNSHPTTVYHQFLYTTRSFNWWFCSYYQHRVLWWGTLSIHSCFFIGTRSVKVFAKSDSPMCTPYLMNFEAADLRLEPDTSAVLNRQLKSYLFCSVFTQ